MTAKEIYERIDLSQLPKEKADKLRELEVKTKGFSIQNDRVDESMRNLYAQLKEKKPSALKDLKVEIEKVETKKGEEVIVKETEKVVGKKEVTQKTPTPSSSKKETITEVAKKIRKEGEEWRQALKRAGEEMRKRDDEASKQVKTELQKLIDFVKNDPNFKDFPRTYGKGRKDIDILKDASEKALAPGRRVSKKGHMNQYGASKGGRKYTENRDNRSDREASKFSKNIFLAKGGRVHRAELMEEGGQVFVPNQILANNPDALVNTTTMSQLFAEGGMAPTRKLFEDGGALYQSDMDADYITYGEVLKSGGKLKYDPSRDVQAIVIQDGPFKKMFIKGDFLGGAYRLANGGLSEDYIYVSPRKVIFARLRSGEDIKPSNGFWIKKNASGTIYTGKEKPKPAFVKSKKFPLPKKITLSYPYKENEKIMKLLGEFSGKDDIRPATTFVSIKDGELVSTNAHYLIRLMDPTTKGENELVCESKSCQNIKKTDLKYPDVDRVIQSFEADFSEPYDFVDLYESLMQARENAYEKLQRRSKNTFVVTNVEFKNNDIKFDSGLLLQTLKGAISLGMQKGFISYSEARNRPIVLTPSQVPTGSKYMALEGKDLILLMPIMGSGYEFESTIVAKQVDIMEAGGEVFVPVQMLANNPDALVNTTTMSELFAKGGKVYASDEAYRVNVIMDGDVKETLIVRGRNKNEVRMIIEDLHEDKMEEKYGDDVMFEIIDSKGDGGKIGFEALSKKVSARYVGKRVDPEYQDEYGKTYSKEEANEVGDKVAAKVYSQQLAKMAEGGKTNEFAGWIAMFNGKTLEIKKEEANGIYGAKQLAIQKLNVPKSKVGLLSINPAYESFAKGGQLEAQSLEMAQNISVQIAHHAMELKEALEGKTYIEPWVTSMLQRAADNLSDATHYLEGKDEKMAKGGFTINKVNLLKGIKIRQYINGRSYIVDYELVQPNYYHAIKGGKTNLFKVIYSTDPKTKVGSMEDFSTNDIMAQIKSGIMNVLSESEKEKAERMAKGGKIREFDDVLVISKNKLGMVEAIADNIYYVTTPFGETIEATMDDLKKVASFKEGGDVKIGEIATLAKENKATGEQVVKKISAGADVEMEHTEDRKVAMRIAVDHLKEDFNYYEKLRKAGL